MLLALVFSGFRRGFGLLGVVLVPTTTTVVVVLNRALFSTKPAKTSTSKKPKTSY